MSICAVVIPGLPCQERRRCVEPALHRGPHWKNTEKVPEGCECRGVFCYCQETGER